MRPVLSRLSGVALTVALVPLLGAAVPSGGEDLPTGPESDLSESAASDENAFNELVGALRTDYADQYAAAEVTPEGEHFGTVSFVGEPPGGAIQFIDGTGLDIGLSTDAAASEREVVAAQEKAYYSVTGGGQVEAFATVDAELGTVSLTVDEGDDVTLEELEQKTTDAFQDGPLVEINGEEVDEPTEPSSSVRERSEPVVSVEITRGEVNARTEQIRGGASITDCTSAFTVSYSGSPGLLTAEHCPSNADYEGRSILSNWTVGNASIDAAVFQSLGETAVPEFYVGSSSTRAVSGSATPTVGSSTCNFGQATGYGCSTVYDTSLCSSGYCGLTASTGYLTGGGDSGGPWFLNNTAHGVHHGMTTLGGSDRSLFTPMEQVSAAMPVTVLTQ